MEEKKRRKVITIMSKIMSNKIIINKKCIAYKCNKEAIVILTINGEKTPLCARHWKESYD